MNAAEYVAVVRQMHIGRTISNVVARVDAQGEEQVRWLFDDGSFVEWNMRCYRDHGPKVAAPSVEGRLFKEESS